jgi:Mce-associated membrane protein
MKKKETGMTDSTANEDANNDGTERKAAGEKEAEAFDESRPKPAERDEIDKTVEANDDDSPPNSSHSMLFWSRRPRLWTAAVLVAAVLGTGVFGFIKFREVTGQLDQLRQDHADRDAASQLAEDYALKSLNYTFEDPDAFFRAVEDGVSQQLEDKYVNAAELLKAVMLDAQVSSTGEVLATDPVAQPDGSYQVVVSAHQTTRNLQNPTPKVSIILLQVTVNKVDNAWQVSDIGPKAGTKPPEEQQIPAPELAPPPTPVKSAPQR